MAWLITNNKFFVRSDRRGCASPVVERKRAKIFEEYINAEEFLRSLPKTMKNLGYYIAPVEDNKHKPSVDTGTNILTEFPPAEAEHESCLTNPEYYLDAIGAFRDFIQTIQNARPKLEEKQVQAEMEIEDLLHVTEFYDLPCEQGFEIYQRIREARIRRRKCKNAVAWIDFVLASDPFRFLNHDPSRRISGSQHRQYRPRVLPEMFENYRKDETESNEK